MKRKKTREIERPVRQRGGSGKWEAMWPGTTDRFGAFLEVQKGRGR